MEAAGVLVLEPGTRAQEQIRDVLKHAAFAPMSATTLAEAVRQAEREPLAAVVADIHVLAGALNRASRDVTQIRASIERLRDAQNTRMQDLRLSPRHLWRLPIIVTAEKEDLAEHAAALNAGADLYLTEAAAGTAEILSRHLWRFLEGRASDLLLAAAPKEVSSVQSHTPATLRSLASAPITAAAIAPEAPARHAADIFDLPTMDWRNVDSGRLDAGKVAGALGVSLRQLAEAVGMPYTTVHKTPDSEALQPHLAPFASVFAMLSDVYGDDNDRVRIWLNTSQSALNERTPKDAMLMPNGARGVEQFVAGAWLGEPD